MIWKRKLAIAAITISGCALVVFAVRRMPSIYVAEAVVLIDSQKVPEKFVSSTVSAELQDRIASIGQQILSAGTLERIISDFDLYKEERKSLFAEEVLDLMRKDISIRMDRSSGSKPEAFRISYQGTRPKVVAQVANRIANLYIEENRKAREGQAQGTSEFLDRQLAEAKGRLEELEEAVGRFKLQYNGELPEQQNALIATLGRLEVELQSNRDALSRAQESKAMLESNLATTEATFEALAAAVERPEAQTPAETTHSAAPAKPSQVLQAQLKSLSSRYGPAYPDVRRLQAEIEGENAAEAVQGEFRGAGDLLQNSEAAPATLPGRQSPDLSAQSNERLRSLQTQIAIAQKEIEFHTQEQTRIASEMKQCSEKISRLPMREQQMAQITRDYEISKANYRNLLDKKLAAEMATDLEHGQKSERFSLLDPARDPEKPQRPNRSLCYALGSFLSLVFGLVSGIGLEFTKGRLLGEWELGPQTQVLARIPKITVSKGRVADGWRTLVVRGSEL
jgi:polysaccharide biosynthesis transport protein